MSQNEIWLPAIYPRAYERESSSKRGDGGRPPEGTFNPLLAIL